MRVALLGDIHSNLEALTAVLGSLAAERIDRYVALGDLVGYNTDPIACLARLRELGVTSVAGNHDWACVGKVELGWFNHFARAAVEWTRNQLSFGDLNMLRALRATHEEQGLTFVHGSLCNPERFEYLLDVGSVLETMRQCRTPICVVGHTHQPCLVEWDSQTRQVTKVLPSAQHMERVTLQELRRYKYVINVGSVGQPRDGDPRACVGIYDTETHLLEVRRVPYDIAVTQQKILAAELPPFLADRLAMGR